MFRVYIDNTAKFYCKFFVPINIYNFALIKINYTHSVHKLFEPVLWKIRYLPQTEIALWYLSDISRTKLLGLIWLIMDSKSTERLKVVRLAYTIGQRTIFKHLTIHSYDSYRIDCDPTARCTEMAQPLDAQILTIQRGPKKSFLVGPATI